MGKIETIKQRAIYVYVPSIGCKERWEKIAEKEGENISKFVIEHVEDSLQQKDDSSYRSRADLWTEVKDLRERLKE